MSKRILAMNAMTHHQDMLNKYRGEISSCIWNTVKVLPNTRQVLQPTGSTPAAAIEVLSTDTVSALYDYAPHDCRVAVLNFASYKNPGGKYMDGSMAQEEALCHESILYEVLSSFDDTYYARNRKNLNYGIYQHTLLYSRDVLFTRPCSNRLADVITCAAPNLKAVSYRPEKFEDAYAALSERAEFVIDYAYLQGAEVLILCAWGCGVFELDPDMVALAFNHALMKHSFRKVIFAIKAQSPTDANLTAFRRVFSK